MMASLGNSLNSSEVGHLVQSYCRTSADVVLVHVLLVVPVNHRLRPHYL